MQNGETSPIPLNKERVMRHLALCGLMGVGKTAVGDLVASRLVRPLRDNDVSLHRLVGATAAEIERACGEAELHRLEAEALIGTLIDKTPAVVTAAASTVTNAVVQRVLRDCAYVVWLDATPEASAARMLSGIHRPLRGHTTDDMVAWVAAVRAERAPSFRAVADLVIDTTTATPIEAAKKILREFNLASTHFP
jgi:shikimate kinase